MNNEELHFIPNAAISISVIARFIFMYLLYCNKSQNTLSLTFCILNICSSSMWVYYSYLNEDMPLMIRSSTEISLLAISSIYIIRNKCMVTQNIA